MLEFTWNIFKETGSIDTYLLFKELEKEHPENRITGEKKIEVDFPVL